MGILTRLSSSSMVGRPIADYLNITVPFDSSEDLRSSVLVVLDQLGCFQEVTPGLFRYLRLVVRKGEITTETLGTVKFGRRGKVATLGTSGGVLRLLRESGLLSEYLAAIASFPHRVTMLHATADFLCADVPAVIHQVKDAAYAGELSLTRKRILPSQCQHVFGVDCDGRETGTVYLGQRANADVWAKVYDKRHERLSVQADHSRRPGAGAAQDLIRCALPFSAVLTSPAHLVQYNKGSAAAPLQLAAVHSGKGTSSWIRTPNALCSSPLWG